MKINERIKELRKEKGITQKELAKAVNITQSNIARYETGQQEPKATNIIALADYFNVSADYLLGRQD